VVVSSDLLRAQQQHGAAALAHRRLDELDPPPPHHPRIDRPGEVGHVPDEHAERSAGRDVHRHGHAERGDRERQDEFHLLAAPGFEALAVSPRRELEPRRLAHLHEVVRLPPDQRDLRGRGGDAARARRARQGLDLLPALFQGREIPAAAPGADYPQPALPLVECQPPADAEPRGATVAVQLAVAERAGRVHVEEP
jgi:hypothetical protein